MAVTYLDRRRAPKRLRRHPASRPPPSAFLAAAPLGQPTPLRNPNAPPLHLPLRALPRLRWTNDYDGVLDREVSRGLPRLSKRAAAPPCRRVCAQEHMHRDEHSISAHIIVTSISYPPRPAKFEPAAAAHSCPAQSEDDPALPR